MEKLTPLQKQLATVFVLSCFSFLGAPLANAGLFSTALSNDNANGLKHIGISSSLGRKLQGQQVGLTAFGNRHFEADIADWMLDAEVRMQLLQGMSESHRLTAAFEEWENAPTGNYKATLAAAREKGFDAVLVIETTTNANDRLLSEGPSLSRRKLPGIDKVYVCNSMRADMYRVADAKRIGFLIPDPCDYTKSLPPTQAWHENWADYTEEDKRLVLEAIAAHVQKQIDEVLAKLNLRRDSTE